MTAPSGRETRGRAGLHATLRRLAAEDAAIRSDGRGGFVLAGRDAGAIRPLSAQVVGALRARDLLEAASGTKDELVLSAAGRALLRRLAAPADPFRAQHQVAGTRKLDTAAGGAVAVNLAETPLGWLARRRGPDGRPLLDRAEVEAGERLRADFTYASLTPKLTQGWAEPIGSGPGMPRPNADPRDAQIAAKQRFVRALDAVGPGLSDVLVAVCCHLEGLEQAEHALGWPARSGKVVLKIALQRLAAHYRIGPAPGHGGVRAVRA